MSDAPPLSPQLRTFWPQCKDDTTGLGARETLEAIIEGRQDLSAEYREATDGSEGGKAFVTRGVIATFKAAARARMLAEDTVLRDAVEAKKVEELEELGASGRPGSGLELAHFRVAGLPAA